MNRTIAAIAAAGLLSAGLSGPATAIDETHCRVRTPLGDFTVVFKVPKP